MSRHEALEFAGRWISCEIDKITKEFDVLEAPHSNHSPNCIVDQVCVG